MLRNSMPNQGPTKGPLFDILLWELKPPGVGSRFDAPAVTLGP